MTEAQKSKKEQLLDSIRSFFVCRQDAFAEGIPRPDGTNKFSYRTARSPKQEDLALTDDILWAHLKGERMVGVYPIIEGDLVGWVAFDFDEGEDPTGDAFKQSDALKAIGLITYVERSRSGTGAHLWAFFDKNLPAAKVRAVFKKYLLQAETYDRMFPNQDRVASGYGNLIALPYNGESFQKGNSAFIEKDGRKLFPLEFFEKARKNKSEVVEKLFEELNHAEKRQQLPVVRGGSGAKLQGALKMCEFCAWSKQAKERMPGQNQEPELYALACQFAQLEGGERLIYEYGQLHPYSDERIEEKWNRALKENKPHTCETLRTEFGDCGKRCDKDFKEFGVTHPYELAKVPFNRLQTGQKGNPESYIQIADRVVAKAERVSRGEEEVGIAYGWDPVDDLTELRNGDLIILASRPSIGKTAAMIDLTHNFSHRQQPSHIISLEMDRDQIGQRLLARECGVDATAIAKGLLDESDWKKLYKAQKQERLIYVEDKVRSLEQILDSLGESMHRFGKGPAFIDYVQLVSKEGKESNTEKVGRAVVGMKAIAQILKIPVVLLWQLSRMSEQDMREGEEPMDSWLKDSGSGEEVADVILYLLGKRGEGLVSRILRIQKERNRGVGGVEISMQLDQPRYKFIPGKVKHGNYLSVANGADDELF